MYPFFKQLSPPTISYHPPSNWSDTSLAFPLAAARGYAEPKIAMIWEKNFIFLFVSSFFISFNFIHVIHVT